MSVGSHSYIGPFDEGVASQAKTHSQCPQLGRERTFERLPRSHNAAYRSVGRNLVNVRLWVVSCRCPKPD
jgi:hypothetical protein